MSDRDFKDYNWPRLLVLLEPSTMGALNLTREVSGISNSKLCRTIITAWLREMWGADLGTARERAASLLKTDDGKVVLKNGVKAQFKKLTVRAGEGTFQ